MYHYHYIIFNTLDGSRSKSFPDGYNTICMHDLEGDKRIEVVSAPLYYSPRFIRYLYGFHNSKAINRIIKLPFNKIWYPYYFKSKAEDFPYCFILLNHDLPIEYLRWLKKKYNNCKIVLLHRDLKEVCMRANPSLPDNPILDLEMTIDKRESELYGYPWYSEFESKIDIKVNDSFPESDVFFAGRVKDRLPKIMEAYSVFQEAGLRVFFYLTGVAKDDRIAYPGIHYADINMTYKEMLIHTVNTRCVLEINQQNAVGYTSRFLEAVIFGKRLITNNKVIIDNPFYKTGHIQVVDNMNEVDLSSIFEGDGFVDYSYNGEFSPYRMIDRVDEELIKKYGAPSLKK